MNAPFTPSTNLAKVRALYSGLTDSDVIAVLSDLIEGAMGTNISDDLLDAMTPLQIGLNEAWDRMEAVARPDVVAEFLAQDAFWRDSHHALRAGMGEPQ